MDECRREDTWLLKHGLYRCGNCGKRHPHMDISEMSHCYWCDHDMKWFETKDGKILPVKFGWNKEDDVVRSMKCSY